jgi:hypothetical protein
MTVTVRSTTIALAGAALVLAAAGCGGGSKSTSTSRTTAANTGTGTPASTPALTKAQFVAKANAICNASNGQLTATALKLASRPSPAEAMKIIHGTFIPQIKAQFGRVAALGVPAGGQAAIATMDRLLVGDVAKIEKDPALAGPGAFHDFAIVAHSYGLTACAPLS